MFSIENVTLKSLVDDVLPGLDQESSVVLLVMFDRCAAFDRAFPLLRLHGIMEYKLLPELALIYLVGYKESILKNSI